MLNRKIVRFFVVGFFIGFAVLTARAEDVKYESEVQKNIMVAMRDGVRLATDVYLPTRNGSIVDGKFPVILTRTPYSKEDIGRSTAKYYVPNGYIVISQDTRGRFKSEGVWHMLTDDGPDGYDTAEWISRQPWSNGKIGMIGTSYVGGTQHAMAMEKPKALRTIIPVDAMSNMGYASIRNSGAFELRFWNWIFTRPIGSRQSRDPATSAVLKKMTENRKHYLLNLPIRRGTTPLKLMPEYEDWLVEAMRHGVADDFWKQNDIIDYPERYKDIPVYLVGGWYDSWGSNTTANYMTLSKKIKGPVYMIMGPWIHGGQENSEHGQVNFGKEAAVDMRAFRLIWYDHWLKGIDNQMGNAPPFSTQVRIFVMGTGDGHRLEDGNLFHGGYWREENEWPLERTKYTKYYFHNAGMLSTEMPTEKASSTAFEFNPRDPVPTIGGNISSGGGIMLMGAWNQWGGDHIWNWKLPIPLSARNDIVVFQSQPLVNDIEVTGEISVKLWASSLSLDTDFTAKLIDVYPPSRDFPGGFDMNIGDGIIRARFRDSLKEEKLMEPGKMYEFIIKLYPTSNVFKKGHRIRVDISSSNFPRFDVNPNTGEPLNDNRRMEIATNTIYHNRNHPSHIILPIIK